MARKFRRRNTRGRTYGLGRKPLRRPRRRAAGRRKPTILRSRQIGGFPDEMKLKLNYGSYGINQSAVTNTIYTFQSSLYDCDLSGGGHQPRFFDQWKTVYQKYCVYGMKIRATVMNTQSYPAYVGLLWYTDSTLIGGTTLPQDMAEMQYGQCKELGVIQGGSNVRTFNSYMSLKKIFGKNISSDEDFEALVSANPAKMLYVAFNTASTSAGTAQVTWRVRITYYCKLFQKVDPGQS